MFSIVATETSVLTFVSVPDLAYRGDWSFLQLALGYIIGRTLVCIFLLPLYFKSSITSIYETLGQRFGPFVQRIASAIFLITRLLADGVRFLATAVVVQCVTGWSLPLSILVIGVVTAAYTLFGGIKTVVWVDSFQFLIYLGGAGLSIFILLNKLDVHAGQALLSLWDSGKLGIFERSDLALRAVFGGVLLSFASHGADYMMVQRALVCKDLKAARMAMLGSGFFVFLQFAVFLLAGSLIFLLYQGTDLPKNRVFSTFITEHLPIGIKGLVLAGVLSAAMSTLSSSINSLASSTIMDWFKKKATLRLSQGISLIWASILILIALGFDSESDKIIVMLGLEIASFTYGGLLGLFLLSLSKRRFHPIGLGVSLVCGLLMVVGLKLLGASWHYFVGAGAAGTMVTAFLTRRITS